VLNDLKTTICSICHVPRAEFPGECRRENCSMPWRAMSGVENQMHLIRIILGLKPSHNPIEAVRLLYEEGREAFERERGDPCPFAHEWHP